jgi:hypothetical protein
MHSGMQMGRVWQHYLNRRTAAEGDIAEHHDAQLEVVANLRAARRPLTAQLLFKYAATAGDHGLLTTMTRVQVVQNNLTRNGC